MDTDESEAAEYFLYYYPPSLPADNLAGVFFFSPDYVFSRLVLVVYSSVAPARFYESALQERN